MPPYVVHGRMQVFFCILILGQHFPTMIRCLIMRSTHYQSPLNAKRVMCTRVYSTAVQLRRGSRAAAAVGVRAGRGTVRAWILGRCGTHVHTLGSVSRLAPCSLPRRALPILAWLQLPAPLQASYDSLYLYPDYFYYRNTVPCMVSACFKIELLHGSYLPRM